MRSNLKQFYCRLWLIILVTLGYNVRLPAHDLPADRSLLDTVTANCFNSSLNAQVPSSSLAVTADNTHRAEFVVPSAKVWSRQAMLHCLVRQASPALAALSNQPQVWQHPIVKKFREPNDLLRSVGLPVKSNPSVASSRETNVILVASPEAGSAPRPSKNSLPLLNRNDPGIKFGEIYMPYDFRVSDWRFGQFPYHSKSVTAPFPTKLPSFVETSREPTQQFLALEHCLLKIEQWQCATYSVLGNGDSWTRTSEDIGTFLAEWTATAGRTLQLTKFPATTATATLKTPRVDLLGPQFVIYDSTVGGHIVLTLAQARQWQFEMPKPHSQLRSLLGAAFEPLQSSARAIASSQLEAAGQSLLKLSQLLSPVAEPKVASRPPVMHN